MKEKYISFVLFLLLSLLSQGQDIDFSKFVINPIGSSQWTNYEYNELIPFSKLLEQNDLLILSEGDHTDGASYDMQCMIMKALIDSGKINTIYNESSWINIDKIKRILKQYGKDSISACEKYINSIGLLYWTKNKFWNYLADQIIAGKVDLIGIDIATTSEKIVQSLYENAKSSLIVKSISLGKSCTIQNVDEDFLNFRYWFYDTGYSEELFSCSMSFIDLAIGLYQKENDLVSVKQWMNIKQYLHWRYYRNFDKKGKRILKPFDKPVKTSYFHSIRDSIMAINFLENFNEKKHNKSILLIAAYHSMLNGNDLGKKIAKDSSIRNFGEYLADRKINFYSICFTASKGSYGVKGQDKETSYPVKECKKGSFESYFADKPYPFLFVDFNKGQSKFSKFYMNPLNASYEKASWTEIFNGVIFIKEMYPMSW